MSGLKAENLFKSYGRRPAVRGVSLEVGRGEIIGLLGRNGAGKTTMFQMIAGLLRPDAGRILLDGQDISSRATDQRARLGLTYLPQEHSVFLKATVAENIRLSLELQPYSKEEAIKLEDDLLQEMGLSGQTEQPAHTLSGGERRRLEIGRALTLRPSFLLLDEPFTGIDPLTILDLQRTLKTLKNKGIGILVSDHNVRDTFHIADRAYIIDEGETLVEGPPAKVAADERARSRFLGKDFSLGEEISPLSEMKTQSDRPASRPEMPGKGRNSRRAG